MVWEAGKAREWKTARGYSSCEIPVGHPVQAGQLEGLLTDPRTLLGLCPLRDLPITSPISLDRELGGAATVRHNGDGTIGRTAGVHKLTGLLLRARRLDRPGLLDRSRFLDRPWFLDRSRLL